MARELQLELHYSPEGMAIDSMLNTTDEAFIRGIVGPPAKYNTSFYEIVLDSERPLYIHENDYNAVYNTEPHHETRATELRDDFYTMLETQNPNWNRSMIPTRELR
jgi:hypothetical protein